MRRFLMVMLLAASVTAGNANPISVNGAKLKLVGEKVIITVGPSESKVTGEYIFQAKGFDGSARNFAQIDMPVILPIKSETGGPTDGPFLLGGENWWSNVAHPIATVNERGVRPWAALRSGDVFGPDDQRTVQTQLPEGWQVVFFRFEFPIYKNENGLSMQISYTQPHLPGNVAAYLPILPGYVTKKNYLINFQPKEGVHFTPVGTYDIVGQVSGANLSVRPANLQLLKVQVK